MARGARGRKGRAVAACIEALGGKKLVWRPEGDRGARSSSHRNESVAAYPTRRRFASYLDVSDKVGVSSPSIEVMPARTLAASEREADDPENEKDDGEKPKNVNGEAEPGEQEDDK